MSRASRPVRRQLIAHLALATAIGSLLVASTSAFAMESHHSPHESSSDCAVTCCSHETAPHDVTVTPQPHEVADMAARSTMAACASAAGAEGVARTTIPRIRGGPPLLQVFLT